MNSRMKNLHELIRYGNTLTVTIPNSLFKSPNFKEQQKALENLKQDSELEITETQHTKLKLNPSTTRTITIKVKQPKRGLTPLEKHHRFRFKNKPVKKPRYNWGARTYLRIKDPETMKRIKKNMMIRTGKGQMIF